MMRLCVFWQGRKAGGPFGVKRFGVYKRCFNGNEINKAIKFTKQVGRRRSGGAALIHATGSGLETTLLTCFGARCRATIFGKKLGLDKGTVGKGVFASLKRRRK